MLEALPEVHIVACVGSMTKGTILCGDSDTCGEDALVSRGFQNGFKITPESKNSKTCELVGAMMTLSEAKAWVYKVHREDYVGAWS